MASKKKTGVKKDNFWNLKLFLVLALTVAAYIPAASYGFVNWDDIIYVMNNDMIKQWSGDNLRKIFSSYYMGNYHPFILLSFTADYSFFGMNAAGYHVHNIILHVFNTFLVYSFFYFLCDKKTAPGLIIALLFAIHPMHVESVAWISERKDLLYTLYFLLSMTAYLFYIRKQEGRYLIYSALLFLFSILSKAQAVTLPLVLVLIDYFLGRKFTLKTILEKVPFFILSLVFGVVAIYAQKADNSVNPNSIPVTSSLFYAQYSIWVYLFKLVFPVFQTCLYEYPAAAASKPPLYVYLSTLIIPLAGYVIYRTWKSQRFVTFGILFFLFTIFPVLQFLPVGQAIVAERYTYIPYIGLFVMISFFFLARKEKTGKSSGGKALTYAGYAVIAILVIVTFNRTKVWFDSVTLWTDVMEKNPKSVTAYVNRGYMYNQYKEYDKAIQDCNDGIRLDSNYFKFYINRGVSYRNTGRFDLALADFSKAIRKNPKSFDTYLDRGIMYTDHFNKYDSGIADFRIYMTFRPGDVNVYYNMGVAWYKKQVFDSSIVYCKKAITLDPGNPGPYFVMALACDGRQDYANAAAYGSKARELGYTVDAALLQSWQKRAGIFQVSLGN